jgi:hypothetical protein
LQLANATAIGGPECAIVQHALARIRAAASLGGGAAGYSNVGPGSVTPDPTALARKPSNATRAAARSRIPRQPLTALDVHTPSECPAPATCCLASTITGGT